MKDTGKVVTTLAGLTAAAYLISQIKTEEEEVILENFINGGGAFTSFYEQQIVQDTKDGTNVFQIRPQDIFENGGTSVEQRFTNAANKNANQPLTGHLKEKQFFAPAHFGNSSALSALSAGPTNVGPNIQAAGRQQATSFGNAGVSAATQLSALNGSETNQAIGAVVNLDAARANKKQVKATELFKPKDSNLAEATSPKNLDLPYLVSENNNPSTENCNPGKVYGGQNLMKQNFTFPEGKEKLLPQGGVNTNSLPIGELSASQFAEEFGEVPGFVPGYMGGANTVAVNTMMYSTLSRAQCPGTRDLIRGDVVPCVAAGIVQVPAASQAPSTVLSTGAMFAMFGQPGEQQAGPAGNNPANTVAQFVSSQSGGLNAAWSGYDGGSQSISGGNSQNTQTFNEPAQRAMLKAVNLLDNASTLGAGRQTGMGGNPAEPTVYTISNSRGPGGTGL